MFQNYPCLDPECSGTTPVLIPGEAGVTQAHGRLAVYFATDDRAKYGHICSLCFQRVPLNEVKHYALYQHGVDGRTETRV